jgi:hypothetical protein
LVENSTLTFPTCFFSIFFKNIVDYYSVSPHGFFLFFYDFFFRIVFIDFIFFILNWLRI